MYLDEGLHFTSFGQLLLSHSFCNFEGVSLDASNDGVRERSLLSPFIILLDNNGFPSGVTALEDDSNLRDEVNGAISF